jgi:hypothetical protein
VKRLARDVAIRRKRGRQGRDHFTSIRFNEAYIRAVESLVACAGNSVYKHAERDADGIENGGFPAPILSYEDRQLLVQIDRAVRKAAEVMQSKTIHA